MPTETTKTFNTEQLDLELAGKNGLRVRWSGPHQCTIEVNDGRGWEPLKYVKRAVIVLDAKKLPRVKLTYFIMPL